MEKNNNEKFYKVLTLADDINRLYSQLTDEECYRGKDSEEYKKLVTYIGLAREYQNKLINEIYSDSFTITQFLNYLDQHERKDIIERISSDIALAKKEFYMTTNELYNELYDQEKVLISRDKYISKKFREYSRTDLAEDTFFTIQLKKLVLIIDQYISETEDKSMKNFLIHTKNKLLKSNKMIEPWYFGFENGLDAMLLDSDKLTAFALNIPYKDYYKMKNDHFVSIGDELISKIFDEEKAIPQVKITYEMYLLAALLNMDIRALDYSYRVFYDEVQYNASLYNKDTIDYVDGLYGKGPMLAKRIEPDYGKEDM